MPPTINSVPSEILARVFSEASCYCTTCPPYEPSPILSPISFSAVCKRWRQIALSHRSLWTHIDLAFDILGDDGRFYIPEVWLAHSKGAPLFVCIVQLRIHDEDHQDDVDEESMLPLFPDTQREVAPILRRLLNFLSPLMPQVCSLTTTIPWPYHSTLAMLIDCWVTYGTPGQAKILKSQADPELSNLDIRSSSSSRSFLESLQVLHLYNTVLSWPDFAFDNLIELQIEVGEGEWTMALPELAAVLASCPRLQHLALDGLAIKPFPSPNPRPVVLKDLRMLRVAGFHNLHGEDGAGMFESVLALIRPGQNAMSVDMSLAYISDSPQQATEAVCSFVNRSNVTTLRVQAYKTSRFWRSPYFASQLGPHHEIGVC